MVRDKKISLMLAIMVRDGQREHSPGGHHGKRQEDLANVGHHGKGRTERTLSWWLSFMRKTNYPSRRLYVYKRRIMVMDSRMFKDEF